MQQVMCLIAPTASGKTALAYELYDTGNYHLISVDSALIYRDMNIGTAKPTADELARYPHALVNIIDPDQSYSVAKFINDVKQEIAVAHHQGKTPLLVGGTMMYYMALLEGMNDIPATLPDIRQQVTAMIDEQGLDKVHQYLHQIDPILAQKLKPNDSQRIGRAIEVYLQTGRAISDWQSQPSYGLASNPNQHWQVIAVMPDRQWLHQRIELRLNIMWQQGFLEEVVNLKKTYQLTADMPSMRCVGYRQAWEFLEQLENNKQNKPLTDLTKLNNPQLQLARQVMENKALYATRQLAKRQYTWMRKLVDNQLLNHVDIQVLQTVDEAKSLLL